MATHKQQQLPRGSRVAAAPTKPPRESLPEPEEVADPTRPRHVIDYTMQRRATLLGLVRGGLREDICDADPILLRTAKYHGEQTSRDCPVCRREQLVCITYTFGAEMGELSGRVRAANELPELALQYGAFRVYVVEVCRGCEWNHLVMSYVLGDGQPRKPPRRGRA
ncbi:MAG: DUF5318 domain-containing protein [Actinomycetia bacterium]|nr:DUF5318 domain-containing protein [Actinomycetes bacterium]MCH9800309.1 DUF5318 domain-containing protein [Actinomycetes bacterium]